jgi:hypothetical protein
VRCSNQVKSNGGRPEPRPLGHPAGVLALLAVVAAAAGGCAARQAVPAALVDAAQVPGLPDVRTWADDTAPWFREDLTNSIRQEDAWYAAHPKLEWPATANVLTISGGGQHGAFGAGLLCGWSDAGTRPQFKLVTGISTGALISPWAFLGPDYDELLRRDYTKVSVKDIYKSSGLFAVLFGAPSLEKTKPLQKLVEESVTQEVLEAIAAEHAKGRRLLVLTTNLDAKRPVIWDMGRIASSGHPNALTLFRQVLVASASIPVAFNPQLIEVEAGGKSYQEMHVDGGTTTQVFLWGAGPSRQYARRELGAKYQKYLDRRDRLYVIRDGFLDAQYRPVPSHLLSVAGAAAATLLHSSLESDLVRLYIDAQRENADYNLAFIPDDFTLKPKSEFDEQYMDALFQMAYKRARAGYPWTKEPPLIKAGSLAGAE